MLRVCEYFPIPKHLSAFRKRHRFFQYLKKDIVDALDDSVFWTSMSLNKISIILLVCR
jgi:hypothetical protein